MVSIANLAKPESLIPNPKAKPPATIQITLQLIDCRSLAVITPVAAKTPIGTKATVLASIPVNSLGSSHKRIVMTKVLLTTHIRQP